MAGEVFISYRRSDERYAKLLHDLLRERGVEAWYDRHVAAGEDWRSATVNALVKAPVFVLLFSKNAAQSDDIVKELSAATFQKKTVIPVRIEDIQPEGAFLYELASRNWFDAFSNTEARLAVLADQLAALVKGGADAPAAASKLGATGLLPAARPARKALGLRGLAFAALGFGALVVVAGALIALNPPKSGGGSEHGDDRVAFFGFTASGDDPVLKDIATRATDEAYLNLGIRRIDSVARGEAVVPEGKSRLDRAAELNARFAMSGEVRRDGDNNVAVTRIEDVASRVTLLEFPTIRSVTMPLAFVSADRAVNAVSCIVTTGFTDDEAPRDAEALAVVASGCGAMAKDGSVRYPSFYRELIEKKIGGPSADALLAGWLAVTQEASPPAVRAGLLEEAKQALARAERDAPDSFSTASARARLAIVTGVPPAKWIPEVEAAIHRQPKANENLAYNMLSRTAVQALWATGRLKDALAYARAGRNADPLNGGIPAQYIALLGATGGVGDDFTSWDVLALKIMRERPTGPFWEYPLVRMILTGRGDVQAMLDMAPLPEAEPYIVDCYRNLWRAMKLTAAADRRAAMRQAEPCLQRWDSGHVIVEMASELGDLDMAFAQLDTLEKVNHSAFTWHAGWFMPRATALRADPRFLPLMEKLGYVDYWKQTKTQPDVCGTAEERDIPLCVMLRTAP